jgi:pimeloyl-ACP methyl ester carboxylesterase
MALAGIVALVMAAALWSCQKAEVYDAAAKAPVIDSVTSEDGVTIYYDVQGSGDKALVFVHCWSCDRSYWQVQRTAFSNEYKVVTIDLGGHGQSGLERETWTMPLFGADVAAVVEKLDLNNVILVGHSMGGPVIIEAARRLPGRVVALVGVDTFNNLEWHFTAEQVAQFIAGFEPDFAAATDQFVRGLFPPTADTALVWQVASDISSAPAEVGISAISEAITYDYPSALKDMRLPIRCISSDMNPINVEGNKQLAQSFEVRLMPGRGHFLHAEDPLEFNRLLRETIAEFWPQPNGS